MQADSQIALLAGLYFQAWYNYTGPLSLQRAPAERATSADFLVKTPGLKRLFVFHRDGRLREAALRQLHGDLGSAFYFTAVAYRLNDWAPQVRVAAVECARRTFPQTSPAAVVKAAMALLPRKHAWGRWGSEAKVLDEAFARRDVADMLAETLREARTGPAGTILRRALVSSTMDGHLLALAVSARLPAVRGVAFQALAEGRAAWVVGKRKEWIDKSMSLFRMVPMIAERRLPLRTPADDLIVLGARDRSAAVRRIAVDALIRSRHDLPNVDQLCDLFVGDRNSGVRERIDFLIRTLAKERSTSA